MNFDNLTGDRRYIDFHTSFTNSKGRSKALLVCRNRWCNPQLWRGIHRM